MADVQLQHDTGVSDPLEESEKPPEIDIEETFRAIVNVSDRRYHLLNYPKCFVGEQAVQAMLKNGMAQTVADCVRIGQQLYERGVFSHVTDDHDFKCEYLFYRFAEDQQQKLVQIGPGFWNIRGEFRLVGVDVGTHMSVVELHNGRFVLLDTCEITLSVKRQIDDMVGDKLFAVLGLHPFHTTSFPQFRKWYPKVHFFGTPRHLREFPELNWSADLSAIDIQEIFAPDLQFRICGENAGVMFDDPQPASTNHIGSIWAYHEPSKTLMVDDTINYFENPSFVMRFGGVRPGKLFWHHTLTTVGLTNESAAPALFQAFVIAVSRDWDFLHICCAHNGVLMDDGKIAYHELLTRTATTFEELTKKRVATLKRRNSLARAQARRLSIGSAENLEGVYEIPNG